MKNKPNGNTKPKVSTEQCWVIWKCPKCQHEWASPWGCPKCPNCSHGWWEGHGLEIVDTFKESELEQHGFKKEKV